MRSRGLPLGANRIYIGTSGYHYAHWEGGVFYPADLPKTKQLEYYTQFFDTVELNVTFYRLPAAKTFSNWYKRTPSNFVFAIKGSRYITHLKRLKEAKEPLERFFERVGQLKEKAGVILWQLPPSFKCNLVRLEGFILALRPWWHYRHAFEFRHRSWFEQPVYELIAQFKMTVCTADWPGLKVDVPSDFPFLYIRRHGPARERLYTGLYTEDEIAQDAAFIKAQYEAGKDVFIYFNNDAFGHAIKNALELKKILQLL